MTDGQLLHIQGGGERYISRRELADRLGVGLRSVDKLVKQGLPSHTWGLRTRKFLWSEVQRWLRSRESARKAA